ncbi:GlsB/YeaQ/YmgE family stress response membrane protein [Phragmitibacter flavus]|uniref:GlsB/YeaQ/YmgE family stress response membrane protein n=1 Tax=Phragmitibacter flavus TaxID=2576071 RepID=A0A5R8KJB1_9BACT|nr:GlsB/YeaQ/YmgE family stress response membrane protein [Phragmitibacter flavus]TLD72372.1 GlsB/YeaQ/YmgE family stress response membrane protein [Phragmitibacter flavus]
MGFLSWILLGLVAGAIAKLIMPGDDKGGCFMTMLLGIVGAIVGGWIGSLLGFGTVTNFDFRSLFVAIVGSLVLLGIGRMIFKR